MHGPSREALAAVLEHVGSAAADAAAADLDRAADDLFAVLAVLDRQPSLRRALSDPAGAREAKRGVVDGLFAARVGALAADALHALVRPRWSAPRDLSDAVEVVGVQLALAAAESRGELDTVEDELFRFGRIVNREPDLRAALTAQWLPDERREELVTALLSSRATATTLRLVRQVVLAPRGRTLEGGLEEYARLAAERRERLIAHVVAARPLSAQQQDRLAVAIGRTFGHQVDVQVDVDPELVGGLTVRVGDELIDASVERRLAEVRRQLGGG